MTANPRLILSLALSGAIAFSGGACAKRKQGGFGFPPAAVQTAPAAAADVPVEIQAFGSTQDRASVDIVPQVSGLLVKALIRDGAIVTNGQPLFLIDPRDYATRVQQTEAAVAADLANLDLARSKVQRTEPLMAQKLVSPDDFDTVKSRAAVASAQLEADRAALEQARLNLERCTIVAPLAGICSKRGVDDGNLVVAGQTRLTNIRSYDPLTIEFSVSEEYLPLIRKAMAEGEVRIEVAPPGETQKVAGVLRFVDNAVNPLTGTILLRGEVPNADLKLWAQQYVDISVIAGIRRDAVMVPESAVLFGKNGSYAYVVSASKVVVSTNALGVTTNHVAEMRPVKTGVRYAGRIQIMEGVAAGEDVVALGQLMLYPGAAVMDLSKMPQGGPGGPGAAGAKRETGASAGAKPAGK